MRGCVEEPDSFYESAAKPVENEKLGLLISCA